MHNEFYVYILKCRDGSYYTGVANNVERRLAEHQQGLTPSCFTFSRRPVSLLYHEYYRDAMTAIRREKQIKKWSRAKKEALIKSDSMALKQLSKNHASTNAH